MSGSTLARPPLQAILWDIDGTLLDSEPWHQRATIAVCRLHGHEMSDQDYAATLGIAFPDLYAQLHAARPMALTFREWADTITDLYLERIAEVEARAGALALVDAFAARGLLQACVSNSGRRVVEANLRHIASPHFLFGLSRDDVSRGKPDPEPYLAAASRLGVAPAACAVIEDSPTGARAAKAAGMLTIAWPQHADLLFDAADHVVEDPAALDWDALCDLAERMAAD